MKRAECPVGTEVRDTRTGRGYTVTGERVHATDCGAWVRDLYENADGVRDGGVIHWSHLEPLEDSDCITVRMHPASGWKLEAAREIQGHRVRGGQWWRITRDGVLRDGPAGGRINSLHNYERFVMEWLEENHPELAAWLKERRAAK